MRLAQEGSEGGELPDSVQGVLAARLDSLPRFERLLVQHASVSGRTFWPGSLVSVAQQEGGDLADALTSLEDKDFVVGATGPTRLGGERELAFKHVLMRDVAYGMLPKTVRARRHFEMARYIEERAGDRGDEVAGLLAEHYGRAAALAQESHLDEPMRRQLETKALEFLELAGDGAAALYSNAEAFDHYATAYALGVADGASRARLREKQGDVALLLGRVDTAIEAWEECLEYRVRRADPARLGDLNRKVGAGAVAEGGRQGGDRALPAGDRPPQGQAAGERAGAALRGGGHALHAHRRQHARHLRRREGSAAGRAPGRGGRGEPGPRGLRAGVRPHGGWGQGAREPGAVGRDRALLGPRQHDQGADRAGLAPRHVGGRLRRRGALRTPRPASWPAGWAT